MKTVANPAREAMTMRHCFTMPLVEQGWTSVPIGLFETSRGTVEVAGVDLVVGIGSLLGTRGIKIATGLVETAAVVVTAESVENEVAGVSAVELAPAESGNCDVEMWVLVPEMG